MGFANRNSCLITTQGLEGPPVPESNGVSPDIVPVSEPDGESITNTALDIVLQVRGLFRPVPYLAFPLYLNSISGNGTETRDTISAGDSYNRYNIV